MVKYVIIHNNRQGCIFRKMNFEKLLSLLGQQGYFDLASVVQLTEGNRQNIKTQLYRWCKSGKLVALRREMYAFAKPYSGNMLNTAEIANRLYSPSYLSTYWALGFYGIIPEKVVPYTSVTSRVTKEFKNAFGVFEYSHIKNLRFFGYNSVEISKRKVMLASPEKSLLDLWYLEAGKWDMNRMQEMRFQNFDIVDIDKLSEYTSRFKSPRLSNTLKVWMELVKSESEGMVKI